MPNCRGHYRMGLESGASDVAGAIRLYREAAALGGPGAGDALCALAILHEEGVPGVLERDLPTAMALYNQSAAAGVFALLQRASLLCIRRFPLYMWVPPPAPYPFCSSVRILLEAPATAVVLIISYPCTHLMCSSLSVLLKFAMFLTHFFPFPAFVHGHSPTLCNFWKSTFP